MEESKENFIIETDGVALQQVLAIEGVDATKTTSNSVTEILQVLGIEATRLSLIYELRVILGSYDIYVNYRHISTLVDIMTLRGILTSITRHGINRTNCGAIRKCTFEETTEILLEAAFFGEKDPLSGISENIIFGQLAPYGTGYFDVVIDSKQLENCIQRVQEDYNYDSYVQHTPMEGLDHGFGEGSITPVLQFTPNPNVDGGNSVYPTSPYDAQPGMMTPTQPGGWMKSPTHPTTIMSPNVYQTAGTPRHHYQQSPGYQVNAAQTPLYQQPYGQTSGQYSPLNNMGSSTPYGRYQAGYSPTNMNNATPTYGSGHYYGGGGMTPQHQMTPKNIYGGGPTPGNTFQMPKPMSPAMNPAGQSPVATSMSGGNSSGHISGSSSNSPSLGLAGYVNRSTPQYQNALMTGGQTYGITATPGVPAYDPNTVPNQDSSDSDN